MSSLSGGGHAGCEAAAASARLGADTLLVTPDLSKIGEMSCNPAIGGLGKGHLVREIDAMDGIMGRVADAAGIQFRILNRRKGPAVQGPRAQSDRKLYRSAMQAELSQTPNLTLRAGTVENLRLDDHRVAGIVLSDGAILTADRIILTTGTFLKGVIHIGEESWPAGRVGEAPAIGLATTLYGPRFPDGPPKNRDTAEIGWPHHRLGRPRHPARRRSAGAVFLFDEKHR